MAMKMVNMDVQSPAGQHVDTAAEYNEIASAYSYNTSGKEKLWLHTTFYTFTNYVERGQLDALKGATVLDLGCGSGVFCRWAASQGAARVVGVDISEQQIFQAHKIERCNPVRAENCTIEYIVGDVAAMDGAEIGQFDILLAAHLLCYSQNRDELQRMLKAASSCLKRGGRLVGVCECLDSASKPMMKVKRELEGGPMFSYELVASSSKDQQWQDFGHCRFAFRNSDGTNLAFTTFPVHQSTMTEMFVEAGFKVDSIGPQMSCSPEGCKLFPEDFITSLINDWGKIISYFDVTKL